MVDISVLMSVYNASDYIRGAIESVLSQKDVDLEFIIVNDRSTDDTPKIIEEYLRKDHRIKVIHRLENASGVMGKDNSPLEGQEYIVVKPSNGHGGQTEGLNVGLEYCTGNYIARLDSDDMCCENRLKLQYDYMESHPDVTFLGGSAIRIDSNGNVLSGYHDNSLSHYEIVSNIRGFKAYCPHSSWFVRKSLYDRLNGYDQDGYRAEDLDLMLRASEFPDVKFGFLEVPVVYLRMHAGGLSYTINSVQIDYAIAAMARHLLRMRGVVIRSKLKDSILRKSKEAVRKTGLHKSSAAYNALVAGYVALKSKSLGNILKAIFIILRTDPFIGVRLKYISFKKLEVARKVAKQFEHH